ncbi:hypothetical protein RvY_08902 [Ramazzottius varieornatus]|uniref:porphobilinogen synthase n=1 Tax=Ramazzottius varieornatus TaxID=947166 RepID=A0A1D1VGN4_RAMVA|nr:hypothetical protein RvY_08902 [Ramazzottius varieornatus]
MSTTYSSEMEAKPASSTVKEQLYSILHSGYSHPVLRQWQATNNAISASHLMYPVFITDDPDGNEEIISMKGQHRVGSNRVVELLEPLVKKGLSSILLFGVIAKHKKDGRGTGACMDNSPIVTTVKIIRKAFPPLVVACDVCLCPYTSHGHCAILRENGLVDNDASISRLAEISLAYAKAGKFLDLLVQLTQIPLALGYSPVIQELISSPRPT